GFRSWTLASLSPRFHFARGMQNAENQKLVSVQFEEHDVREALQANVSSSGSEFSKSIRISNHSRYSLAHRFHECVAQPRRAMVVPSGSLSNVAVKQRVITKTSRRVAH